MCNLVRTLYTRIVSDLGKKVVSVIAHIQEFFFFSWKSNLHYHESFPDNSFKLHLHISE